MLRQRQQKTPATPAPTAPEPWSSAAPTPPEEAAAVSGRSKSKVPGRTNVHVTAAHQRKGEMEPTSERSPLLDDEAGRATTGHDGNLDSTEKMAWSRRNQWIIFAIASGACAALNGVMAKLTTTELTTSLSNQVAHFLGLSNAEGAVEVVVRATFFGLNLTFNGVMWTLFTQALSRGHSTTQVSIMNTSSNFVLTALLGFVIFSESLPPLWWLGASMLVAGNVIIGRKDEGAAAATAAAAAGDSTSEDPDIEDPSADAISVAESGRSGYEPIPQAEGVLPRVEKDDEDVPQLGDLDRQG